MDLTAFFNLVSSWAIELGYFGAFVLGFFSSFTLFIPSPTFIGVFTLASLGIYNPFLLGIFGGLGSTIGDIISFEVGSGGKRVLINKYKNLLFELEKKFQKYGGFILIFIFSATPLPFDIIGILCGTIGYPFKKFLIATFLGKIVKYLIISYAGFYGIQWIISYIIE